MNAISSPASSRSQRRPTHFVIVRANAPLFYSITIASFLESDAARSSARLLELLGADETLGAWLRTEWLPAKTARANTLRQYVEQQWPEFDWGAGLEHYRSLVAQHGGAPYRARPAYEALGRCVIAAESGLYYRALARWSDDHALRALARSIAHEEAAAFCRFRAAFERRSRRERVGVLAAWRTVRACVRHGRDTHVQFAFDALNAYCGFNAPFPVLDYPEFLARMRSVVERCARPIWSERVLFKAWSRAPRIITGQTRQPAISWFKPVLSQVA